MSDTTSKFETLIDSYLHATSQFGPNPLFGEKKNGQWQWTTYAQFAQTVDAMRGALAARGVTEGDRVAVISNNRTEWAVCCYAVYGLGAAYVPMYEAQLDKEWEYILQDCGARVLFVANAKIADRINAFRARLPKLELVVRFDGTASETGTYAQVVAAGAASPAPLRHPKPGDMSGLIYTSGTTGNPKGVMLSHSNLAKNISAMHDQLPMNIEDRSLSFLPWAHSFGQVVELHGLLSMGASIAIAESVEKIVDNMGEVKPTLLFSVPRIFNRIYDGLQKRMAAEKPLKRKLFYKGLEVSARRRALSDQHRSSVVVNAQHRFFDKLVFAKVRARFGGRLKYAFSGGAAISREVAEFIDNLGINVFEGYGLTETSPIFTVNFPGNRKIGSVGKPIPGTRVEIDHAVNPSDDPRQGEIVCHGHNVMMGYYNLPDENAKVFTSDHGFRTGDLGYIDAEGYLYITGRVKEQYKLENGKYVVPVPIEQSIALSPFVANVMVHGQNKPFNVAVIVPDLPTLKSWATEKGIATEPLETLFEHPAVRRLYQDEINAHCKELKGYERPDHFVLVAEDFTTANDMLTPSLKLKRRNVVARYDGAIEALYRAAAEKHASAAA